MNFKQSLQRGVLYSFIPKRLEISGRSELAVFPLNVLFAQYKAENGKIIMGSTVYEPDIESLTRRGDVYSLHYLNGPVAECAFVAKLLRSERGEGKKSQEYTQYLSRFFIKPQPLLCDCSRNGIRQQARNAFGGTSRLVIEYNAKSKSYVGRKIVNDKFAGEATGTQWNRFFTHFTALGLANGERCEFEAVNS